MFAALHIMQAGGARLHRRLAPSHSHRQRESNAGSHHGTATIQVREHERGRVGVRHDHLGNQGSEQRQCERPGQNATALPPVTGRARSAVFPNLAATGRRGAMTRLRERANHQCADVHRGAPVRVFAGVVELPYFFSRSSVASLRNIGRRRFAAFARSQGNDTSTRMASSNTSMLPAAI